MIDIQWYIRILLFIWVSQSEKRAIFRAYSDLDIWLDYNMLWSKFSGFSPRLIVIIWNNFAFDKFQIYLVDSEN